MVSDESVLKAVPSWEHQSRPFDGRDPLQNTDQLVPDCASSISRELPVTQYINDCVRSRLEYTNIEHLNVVQDVIIEGKVVAGNNIDSGIFLYLPVFQA